MEPIHVWDAEITLDDPLSTFEAVVVAMPEVPRAAVYHCELMCATEVLMSRRIIVQKAGE